MSSSRQTQKWGYQHHPKSIEDVEDWEVWNENEKWAIRNALDWASSEQLARYPRDFMEVFHGMLDANLHQPLNLATETSDETVEDTTEQEALDAF